MDDERAAAPLLGQPHHDTGPAYLLGDRREGATLTARVWVPAGHRPHQVVLRQVVDGEPVNTEMEMVEHCPSPPGTP